MAVRGQPVEHSDAQTASQIKNSRPRTVVTLAVFATFFIAAAVRAPVPSVGEPHYLSKAKHFWQPDWCAQDLFLSSSNPHVAFYTSIGWLSRWGTLEWTAWIGRAVSQLLLALGWTALISRLAVGRWTPLWTAWGFLGLSSLDTLAGEWIIGGVEGKVFSYAFLFLALAAALDRRWTVVAMFAGISVSFHPIVGIWGLSALVFTTLAVRLTTPRHTRSLSTSDSGSSTFAPGDVPSTPRAACSRLLPAGLLFIVCALPGLLPSFAVVLDASSPKDSFAANYIQVFYRLDHHLDPNTFSPRAAAGYLVMSALAWLLLRFGRHTAMNAQAPRGPASANPAACIRWYVLAVCLIALGGAAIGLGPIPTARTAWQGLRLMLMKFYPFRLFDVIVPFALTLALADRTARWLQRSSQAAAGQRTARGFRRRVLTWFAWSLPLVFALSYLPQDRNASRMDAQQLADWKDMCAWIDAHLPDDALVCTPYGSWAFKWYAQRAEFVSYKDCPQDAAGIVEWNRRLKYLDDWGSRSFEGGYSIEELQELRDDTSCSHWLAHRAFPVYAAPVYQRGAFRLYDLHALSEQTPE